MTRLLCKIGLHRWGWWHYLGVFRERDYLRFRTCRWCGTGQAEQP